MTHGFRSVQVGGHGHEDDANHRHAVEQEERDHQAAAPHVQARRGIHARVTTIRACATSEPATIDISDASVDNVWKNVIN